MVLMLIRWDPELKKEAAKCRNAFFLLVGQKPQLQAPHPVAADVQAGAAANGRNRERRPIAETPSV